MPKPLILWLHGATGASQQFSRFLAPFEPFSKSVAFDFTGHGHQPEIPHEPLTIELLADQLEDVISVYAAGRPVYVFGYSMGGYVALFHAIKYPGLISKIYTLGTKFDWSSESAEKECSRLLPEVIETKVPKLAELLQSLHGDHWKKLCLDTQNLMRSLGKNPLLTEPMLKQLKTTVRIGVGDSDSMVTLDETIYTQRLIANSTLSIWPQTPHSIEQISPERLTFELQQFFFG